MKIVEHSQNYYTFIKTIHSFTLIFNTMKKTITILFVAALLVCCTYSTSMAQTNTGHLFHVHTWYMVAGMDSTDRANRDALLKEYFEKVDMKNEFILHTWSMTHYYTEDSREYVTVSEYASWDAIDKANNRSDELAKQAWPDAQKRKEFMKKMNGYFTYHKDAIYHSLPGMMK